MSTLFLICAVVGGTLLVCQFVLTLVGLGHHDIGVGHDAMAPDSAGVDLGHDSAGQHGSTWLFGVLSFRTLVAALTFIGLGGMAAYSAAMSPASQIVIAVVCGVSALYATHWIMCQVNRLGEDGTVRITRAIGQEGTVYLSIPPSQSATGKVQIKVQNRLMEYEAVTAAAETLVTGARVVVVGIEGGNLLKVEPVRKQVATESES